MNTLTTANPGSEALRAIMRSFEFEPVVLKPAARLAAPPGLRRALAGRKTKLQSRKS